PAGRNLRPRAGSDPGAVRLDRGEPLQLCHVVRGEVGEAGGPEQLHGPLDLAGQDFDGPVHALPATGHQAVQVGPADQSEVGAHGDRCHDIGAVHDAGVEDDLRAAAELLGHVREHVERDRCSWTGHRSRSTCGSMWNGIGARSSCRPPWLDSTMPSTPRSATRRASSRVWMPLTTTLPGHWPAIQRRSSKSTVGSNMVSSSWATLPDQRSREAKDSGSVVRKSNHHFIRGAAFSTVFGVRLGGMVMPLRASRRRAPPTGTSTVTRSVSKPALAARSTSAMDRSRSFHMYSWNPVRPVGLAWATSSIELVPMVHRE